MTITAALLAEQGGAATNNPLDPGGSLVTLSLVKPQHDPDGKWLRINTDYAKIWPNITVKGTPPAMFVIACTTALFDDPKIRSVGERLMDRWNGPLAYYGATRVCHPAWNSIVG